ncbi:MAG TPA: hypothetical protein VER76_15485, partial [Pyrinomonadaceae bacterium]|nr:hypothetical protein [Pyrinomonadaceae bacterium]
MNHFGIRVPSGGCGREFSSLLVLILIFASCVQVRLSRASGVFPEARGRDGAHRQQANQATGELTVAKVLANVRKAINYERVERLRGGFVVEAFAVDTKGTAQVREESRVLTSGAGGAFREDSKPVNARPFGFDGSYGWQVD